MPRQILIKPIISEKAERLSEGLNKYSFVVRRDANKIEIRDAVQTMYNVSVTDVNTMVIPGKAKSRFTRRGVQRGQQASFKKAVVTVAQGEEIDFFTDI